MADGTFVSNHYIGEVYLDRDVRTLNRTIRILDFWRIKQDGVEVPLIPQTFKKSLFGGIKRASSQPIYRAVELTNERNPKAVGRHIKVKESTLDKKYYKISH